VAVGPDGRPLKSKMTAGLLGIFLGSFGVHRFYLGYTGIGIAQIAVTIVTCGIGGIWGLIEGILILTGSPSLSTDAEGRPLTA
jgi:TM2 domain-containing membrane protein YozV